MVEEKARCERAEVWRDISCEYVHKLRCTVGECMCTLPCQSLYSHIYNYPLCVHPAVMEME